MSEVQIKAVKIEVVLGHPNADRLEIVRFGGYTVCVQAGKHKAGDIVAHFPPDILIPKEVADSLGVTNYLKHSIYPGDAAKSKCRVGAVRLRGIPSFGFCAHTDAEEGADLTANYRGVKYEPPEPEWYRQGVCHKSHPKFHTYTNLENGRKPEVRMLIEDGTPVRITEKIHGTNSRVALIDGEFICGSHRHAVLEYDAKGNRSAYWYPLTDNIRAMLTELSEDGQKAVIAFGEIYGSKVQFMDYGKFGFEGYVLFDISVEGQYLPWADVERAAKRHGIQTAPLLYTGPLSSGIINQLVDGPTVLGDPAFIRSEFKGREGIVVTTLDECFSPFGRTAFKVVSVDYLECRKSDSH
ncbi:MAG: hypothetical protein AMXMBFR16_10650 [Candidatus Uhrbacteria bacterium]